MDKKNLIGVCALWFVVISAGMYVLVAYSNSFPDNAGLPPLMNWNEQQYLDFVDGKSNLVMFLHPFCPCSLSSMRELQRMYHELDGKNAFHFVFFQPEVPDEKWKKSSLVQMARKFPGAIIHYDAGGTICREFNATTSGQVMVYGTKRKLLYNGGITPGRGHEGDNSGEKQMVQAVKSQTANLERTLVFGCQLY